MSQNSVKKINGVSVLSSCKRCGSDEVERVRKNKWERFIDAFASVHAYSCDDCGDRQMVLQSPKLLMTVLVLLLIGIFIFAFAIYYLGSKATNQDEMENIVEVNSIKPIFSTQITGQYIAENGTSEQLAVAQTTDVDLVDTKEIDIEVVAEEALATTDSDLEQLPLLEEQLAQEKLLQEKLSAENEVEKLAEEKLAAEKLAEEKLAEEKLAAEKLAEEKLAEEKLAVENLAEEKLTQEEKDDLAAEIENNPLLFLDSERYTIQIFSKPSRASAIQLIHELENLLSGPLYLYRSTKQEQDWFPVLFGNFASFELAESALSGLPTVLKENGPFIRKIATVQDRIKGIYSN